MVMTSLSSRREDVAVTSPPPESGPSSLSSASSSLLESSLWDSSQDWILIFDSLLKHPTGKASKGCRCDLCLTNKTSSSSVSSTSPLSVSRKCGRRNWTRDAPVDDPFSGTTDTTESHPDFKDVLDNRGEDETDRQSMKSSSASSSKSRSSSVPAVRRNMFAVPKSSATAAGGGSGGQQQAGAVDEECFLQAFEDVKQVHIFNARSLSEEWTKIRETLAKTSNDWKVRIEALKRVRSLLVAGADCYDETHVALRTLELPFQSSIKDLRSQVVREACLSVAYISQRMRNRVDRFLESLLQHIISLIPNSTKIMSSSGIVCMRFIIRNTYSARFLPTLVANVSSKSREIRRHCCEFIQQLVHTWPTHALEKHVVLLQEAIKKGVADADPEARAFSRKAYWGFADHFKDHADVLLNSLDNSHRRMLQSSAGSSGIFGCGDMSNSSSSNSLNMAGRASSSLSTGAGVGVTKSRSRQASITSSQENLLHGDGLSRKFVFSGHASQPPQQQQKHLPRKPPISGIPLYTSPIRNDSFYSNGSPKHTPGRSNSAIDPSAVRRASVRAQYAQRNRMGLGFAGSTTSPRGRKASDPKAVSTAGTSLQTATLDSSRNGRSRSRMSGSSVTHSQPGSRSTSPTSLKSYHTYMDAPSHTGYSPSPTSTMTRRRSSGIPRSTGVSREASPNRQGVVGRIYHSGGRASQVGGSGRSSMTPDRPPKRPTGTPMSEKLLRQSREAEKALEDALSNSPARKRVSVSGAFEDASDESEASSVSSEKSFDFGAGRRASNDHTLASSSGTDRFPWMGDPGVVASAVPDITEIIANCASTHWADRKDGLLGLRGYFRDGMMLSGSELRRVTDIFGRMFMDAHTKVFTLFLDTLIDLVVTHKADLCDWLYVLLTRLLIKLGGDLLGSIIHKINRTLDIVKESFPPCNQLSVLMRFLADQALTPNSKVKIATVKHLQEVAAISEASDVTLPRLTVSGPEQEMALAKVITWTCEPKSADVRRYSQGALIALFRLNSVHLSFVLRKLPKVCQENAAELLPAQLIVASEDEIDHHKAVAPMKPRTLQSPNNTSFHLPHDMMQLQHHRKSLIRTTPSLIDPVDDSENLNPEEIHKSLRSTANAIQNYNFNSACDTKSDAQIMSAVDDDDLPEGVKDATAALQESMAKLDIACSSAKSSVVNNGGASVDVSLENAENECVVNNKGNESRIAIQEIIEELQHVKTQSRATERRQCMSQLIRMIREGKTSIIEENFRSVLRLLLDNLSDETGATRALVFAVLMEMLKQDVLIANFRGFTELIILKALEAHRDREKEVERSAEACAAAMASVLPPEMVVRVLNPIIKTGEFPENQAAIKMLTKVAEHKSSRDVVNAHLSDVMPGLLKAYDNVESSVRKASVFCMVALHQLVGEKLQPHLETLNVSKLKLLNLYIRRAQAHSTSTTPRLTTPS